ncbi:MAG: guanylate kinase [Candidatus Margulisiibacteriota bacterium]|nr:MAG: guanylate kinase [Candidatus Margulisiibacteriota bacterium]HAR63105.1 guanylate kinase [Candidatus Margulisiibacteriota bacterium]HCT86410.1 guanylate kinase [Candidatus Margulisiibacteriota bacterium]HCY36393.1 guanylate kinase [Candidatus Margulisiibacteriota bacterium]
MTGFLVVIAGPSGVGKGTIVKKLVSEVSQLSLSISSTTRASRDGEINGREYFFLSDEEFSRKVEQGEFLEWADVHGKRYGTDSAYVLKQIHEGNIVILEIDVQGADHLRTQKLDTVTIFLTPPSMAELEKRLRERKTEAEDKVQSRLRVAQEELYEKDKFEYIVENNDIVETTEKIKSIIQSERRKRFK